ncbi:MAG: hypothetical protein ACRD3Q_01790 [Terriglobales bacterium]
MPLTSRPSNELQFTRTAGALDGHRAFFFAHDRHRTLARASAGPHMAPLSRVPRSSIYGSAQ